MSIFTFANEIGERTHITMEEIDFLIKVHNISKDKALKILREMMGK